MKVGTQWCWRRQIQTNPSRDFYRQVAPWDGNKVAFSFFWSVYLCILPILAFDLPILKNTSKGIEIARKRKRPNGKTQTCCSIKNIWPQPHNGYLTQIILETSLLAGYVLNQFFASNSHCYNTSNACITALQIEPLHTTRTNVKEYSKSE